MLIRVEDGGKDILRSILLFSKVKCFLIEAAGILIAAMFFKILRIHIEDDFIEHLGVFLQSTEGNLSFLHQLV